MLEMWKSKPISECGMWLKDAKILLSLAGPLIVQQLVIYTNTLTSSVFAGHLGDFELSVVVLASSIYSASGQACLVGASSVMETFCGQAFGAKQFRAVGTIFQRALWINICLSLGISIVYFKAKPILLFLGQDPEIAAAVALYLQYAIPSLFCTAIAECGKRYLMAQNSVTPLAVVYMLGAVMAPFYNYFFIYVLNYGLYGAAISVSMVFLQNCLLLVLYIWHFNKKLENSEECTWPGWTASSMKNWGQYLKVAFPSVLMLCLEWWLFEAMVLLAGLLENPRLKIATIGVLMNALTAIYQVPYGLGNATSTQVSIRLGRGDSRGARNVTICSMSIILCVQCLFSVALLLFRDHLGSLYTADPDVIQLAASLVHVIVFMILVDGCVGILSGVIRGCGKQAQTAVYSAISYWVLGLPISALCAFVFKLDMGGLWIGLIIASYVQTSILLVIVYNLDWKQEADKAVNIALEESKIVDGGSHLLTSNIEEEE